MKKKGLKLLALAGALFLIVLLGWTANGLIGNPISRYLADKNARKYLEKHFPNTDYYIEDTSYSFKEGAYIADVKAPGSMDRYFSITMDMAGRYRWDSYENVEDGFHTFLRLDEEYRKLTDRKKEKFYEQHSSEITACQAAKRYFNSLGLKKLPSMQSLKQEYAVLQAEKKKRYPEYRQAKEKMIELLTAKNNVERILGLTEKEKNRDRQQRAR